MEIPSRTSTRSYARMEAYAGLGIDQVWVMPPAEDPVGYVGRLCDEVLPRLRELG